MKRHFSCGSHKKTMELVPLSATNSVLSNEQVALVVLCGDATHLEELALDNVAIVGAIFNWNLAAERNVMQQLQERIPAQARFLPLHKGWESTTRGLCQFIVSLLLFHQAKKILIAGLPQENREELYSWVKFLQSFSGLDISFWPPQQQVTQPVFIRPIDHPTPLRIEHSDFEPLDFALDYCRKNELPPREGTLKINVRLAKTLVPDLLAKALREKHFYRDEKDSTLIWRDQKFFFYDSTQPSSYADSFPKNPNDVLKTLSTFSTKALGRYGVAVKLKAAFPAMARSLGWWICYIQWLLNNQVLEFKRSILTVRSFERDEITSTLHLMGCPAKLSRAIVERAGFKMIPTPSEVLTLLHSPSPSALTVEYRQLGPHHRPLWTCHIHTTLLDRPFAATSHRKVDALHNCAQQVLSLLFAQEDDLLVWLNGKSSYFDEKGMAQFVQRLVE